MFKYKDKVLFRCPKWLQSDFINLKIKEDWYFGIISKNQSKEFLNSLFNKGDLIKLKLPKIK